MIEKINKTGLVLLLAAITFFSGCSDDFLKEKKNYGNYTEDIYENYEGAKGRINYLYKRYLPKTVEGATNTDSRHTTGNPDIQSKSTEEYGGLSEFVNPDEPLDYKNVDDWFRGEDKIQAVWGGIRNCNMIIAGITKSEGLTQKEKEELLGQAYFFRGWAYYRLVKIYGGVPIVLEVQNPIVEEGDMSLIIPRSTTKECIDLICADLRQAADYLPSTWEIPANDYGRVTKGTALALMGRTRLLYASPLFNRGDDQERWKLAYEANKEAMEELYYSITKPGNNANAWSQNFATYAECKEAVFVTLYNNLALNEDYTLNNNWENNIRPVNLFGGGGRTPTAQIIDIFPMADGKRPSNENSADDNYTKLESSKYMYDKTLFFLNRDPRFYRTFAFPGVKWGASGVDIGTQSADDPLLYPYSSGEAYELWSYSWQTAEDVDKEDSRGFYADGLGSKGRGIFVRKRSNELFTPLYSFKANDGSGFKQSGAPYMEIRFGEVLLNFAEAACGYKKYDESLEALQEVRARVGYTSDNNYGLEENLKNDRAKLFSAILYERQIELAYEGKRFDDMRRWLLWDGGEGQEALKASWKLTGFDGNTCTYLGVKPLNGVHRKEIEVRATKGADQKNGADPILTERPATGAVDVENGSFVVETDVDGDFIETPENKKTIALTEFYRQNTKRFELRMDGDATNVIKFLPRYYLIGFNSSIQTNNAYLEQTVGWYYMTEQREGIFDPLAE